jgi:protease-4
MKFLGNVLATIIGLFIFYVVLFGNTNCRAVFGDSRITVKNNSVIVLNLEDIKYDYAENEDPDLYFFR